MERGDCSTTLRTAAASPLVCVLFGAIKNISLCPKEVKEDGQRTRRCNLGVEAEDTGLFSSEGTKDSPLCCLQLANEMEGRGKCCSAVP